MRRLQVVAVYLATAVVALVALFPLIWLLLTSLKETREAFSMPPHFLFTPTMKWYSRVWIDEGFARYFWNTAVICAGTVLLAVPIAGLAAYALSRYRSMNTYVILVIALGFTMLPEMLIGMPIYLFARMTHLYNTPIVVILALAAQYLPLLVWLLRGFFLEIPIAVEECALVDGCNRWRVFWSIALPMAKPGLITACLLTLIFSYNAFLFPLILTGPGAQPLSVAIAQYGAQDIRYWSVSAAGAVSIAIPLLIAVVVAQRYLIGGITFGAVKE